MPSPQLSPAEREDLHERLGRLADDELTYMHLGIVKMREMLGCSRYVLERAMLDTLTPSPQEVRENVFLELVGKDLLCREIAEIMGMGEQQVWNLAHRMGVTMKRIHSGQRLPWTAEDDQVLIEHGFKRMFDSQDELYEFLGRNRGAVEYRLFQLRRRGTIKHKFWRRNRAPKAAAEVTHHDELQAA
jgi:biotin operon repressor